MTKTEYKLAALFFFILGVTCAIGTVVMFKTGQAGRWVCLGISVFGLLAAAAIRFAASQKQ